MLPDLLRPGLTAVFCGSAAGTASAKVQAYYAGRGNKFWRTLHVVGLTPRELKPSEYRELLSYGVGLTDVCKTAAGSDEEVAGAHRDVAGLVAKIEEHHPQWIGFNGKAAAKAALARLTDYGPQPEALGGARVFVLPSTSGAARGAWSIEPWRAFARMIQP